MEILTLKGNGKSKLLMQLMNECESKRALMIIYKGQNVSKSWIPYGCICAETDDIKLVEKSWKKILQKMKEDKNQVIRALLQDVDSFNISEDTLYIIFTDNYSFAKSRLDSPATIQYVEKVIREVLNRSFSVKIALKSQLSNLNTQIKKEDKGEQILKNIVSEDILEVKDSIEKR